MFARLPIAIQVSALTALGILISAAAMVAITFGGPPPRQPPHKFEDIVLSFQTGRAATANLLMSYTDDLEELTQGYVPDSGLEAQLADAMRDTQSRYRAFHVAGPISGGGGFMPQQFVIARQEEGRSWTVLRNGADRDLQRWRLVTFSTIGAVLLVILTLAWLASQRIVRPIQQLAVEARSSNARLNVSFDAAKGPPEISAATEALRDLYDRTQDHAEQRMAIMAAIAHDIGTPLARLAFRNEKLPEGQRVAAMRDIETIRQLLADSRTFTQVWTGKMEPCDLARICSDIAGREQETGHNVDCVAPDSLKVVGNALSLQRMVQNLVDNALRYGSCARVTLACEAGEAVLRVADHGDGFPDVPQEELLRPFVRGEQSRNVEHGGSGLGLAIVAQAVAQHGGTIELGSAAGGGALVTVRLPMLDA